MNSFIYSYLRYNNIYNILFNIFTIDIIEKIVKYIYIRKDKYILNDIENFVEIRSKLFQLYYNRFANHNILLFNDDGSKAQLTNDKYYLINDLEIYYNIYHKENIVKYYDIWKRNFSLLNKNNIEIEKYIIKLNKTNIDKQINIYLGLLTPYERIDFLNNQYLLEWGG